MGATFAGQPFRPDPTSVSWDYNVHVADRPYIGGKVVQVFGAHIGDITIDGAFSRGSWEAQAAFLARIKSLGSRVVDDAASPPLRFLWPEMGWDFQVYLKAYENPSAAKAVVLSAREFAPKWRLLLFPVAGTDTLKEATVTSYIDRLASGMGWKLGPYNGSLTYTDAQRALAGVGATNVQDFYNIAFGGGGLPSNISTQTTTSSGQNFPSGRALSVDEMTELCYRAGWRGADLPIAVAISKAESGWNPTRVNDNASTNDYSVGLFQINMLAHSTRFGTEEELKIPERNAAAAFSLYQGRRFQPWSVFNNGRYLQYLPEAQAAATRKGY